MLEEVNILVSDITDQDFEKEVLKSDLPAMVDFWAPWCRPCQMIAPATEKLSEEFEGKLKFYKKGDLETPVVELKVNATDRCHIVGAFDFAFRCPGIDEMLGSLLKHERERRRGTTSGQKWSSAAKEPGARLR